MGTALLLADGGEHERAVELYAVASGYPFVANLPLGVAETARERGRAQDLRLQGAYWPSRGDAFSMVSSTFRDTWC